jgi:hypothetical protein
MREPRVTIDLLRFLRLVVGGVPDSADRALLRRVLARHAAGDSVPVRVRLVDVLVADE